MKLLYIGYITGPFGLKGEVKILSETNHKNDIFKVGNSLYIDNKNVVGLIMGIIPKYDENDYLDYKCPKKGEVTELIIKKEYRNHSIGKILLNKMEEYFRKNNCEYSFIDVFAYNKSGINFYDKNGYHSRMIIDIKKL